MFCSKYGKDATGNFCSNCGNSLNNDINQKPLNRKFNIGESVMVKSWDEIKKIEGISTTLGIMACRPTDPTGVGYSRLMDGLKGKIFTISDIIYAGNSNISLYLLKGVKNFTGFPEYALEFPMEEDVFKKEKKGWKRFF